MREQSKNEIAITLFPCVLRIYLIPQLNVLTIEFKNKVFTTDDILGDLNFDDQGTQLSLNELNMINS